MSDWQTEKRRLLDQVELAVREGNLRSAVRGLQRLRSRSLSTRDVDGLREVAALARSLEQQARGRMLADVRRLAYAAERNAEFVAARTPIQTPKPTPAAVPGRPTEAGLERRLAAAELQLQALQTELADIRRLAVTTEPKPVAAEPRVATQEAFGWEPEPVAQEPPVAQPPPAAPPLPPVPSWIDRAAESLSEKSAAWILAWAGGVVTALGIVLFFALAVNRGWIGPEARVAAGALASALVFASGAYLRRRFGATYSSLAAVGAGIAGAYATLLAAAALYDLLADWQALLVAGGIAGVGLLASLAWKSEFVAGLGLIGAMLVPLAVLIDEDISFIGTAFTALVLIAAGIVSLRLRWNRLAVAATLASAPQIIGLVADGDYAVARLAALAAFFALVYVAIGAARQLLDGRGLAGLPSSMVLTGAAIAAYAGGRLFDGRDQGFALLVVAGVLAAPAVLGFSRRATYELANLFAAVSLAIGAVAVADLFSDHSLAVAWAAEAAALAWLAHRVREPRFQLAALAYLGLALGHSLAIAEWPRALFQVSTHPADSWPTLILLIAASLSAGWFVPAFGSENVPREGIFGALAAVFEEQLAQQRAIRVLGLGGGAVLAVAMASLAILELAVTVGSPIEVAFDRGQVAVDVLWALVGVIPVWFGVRRRSPAVAAAGWLWLGVLLAKLVAYDVPELVRPERSLALLVVGAALLAAAYARRRIEAIGVAAAVVSLPLLTGGAVELVHRDLWGMDANGLALLAVSAVYGLLAAGCFRARRDFATLLWGSSLVLLAAAWPVLVSGVWLVLAWAACATGLAVLADVLGERRFLAAAYGFLFLALAHTLSIEAPLEDLFTAQRHPGDGVPAVLVVVAAIAVTALIARRTATPETGDSGLSATLADGQGLLATITFWIGIGLTGYAGSLAILELAQAVSTGSVDIDFQRGHVGVSAFWGVVGLVLLYLGLVRHSQALRVAGFIAFGVTVGKIFFYDLSNLSAVARALSFLGVGAVLLLGGFFYQRLSAELEERRRPPLAGAR